MNKNIKNIMGILLCLVLISGMAWFIGDTYAKYRDQINGQTNANMTRWNIKVNTEEIKGKTSLTAPITAYFPATTYTAAGVVAPGSRGYFDIIIDSSEVDVAFNYTITCTVSSESVIEDMQIIGYKLSPQGVNDMSDIQSISGGAITGIVPVGIINTTIRVYVEWYDGNGENMDNADDTDVVLNNTSSVIMDTTLGFSQYR